MIGPTCDVCSRPARRRVRVNGQDHLYCLLHDFDYQPNTGYTVQVSIIDPPSCTLAVRGNTR